MTVENISRRAGPFIGDGTVTAFPFEFKVFNETQIAVHVADGNNPETVLTLNEDYTVALNEDQNQKPGGTVTLLVPLGNEKRLAIISVVAATQTMRSTNYDRFYPETYNDAFDKATILIQQLLEQVSRALITDPTDTITPRQLRDKLLAAVDEAVAAAGASKETLAACEAIKDLIERYSWDIPHLVNSLEEVEAYPYDGYFWVKGYGNPGNAGEDISNRLVGGRTLAQRFGDVISVKDFGAKGDGVTDDTEAIQKAVDTGKNIFFPPGGYLIDTATTFELKEDTAVFGLSRTITAIVSKQSTDTELPYIFKVVGNNVSLSDISFNGGRSPDATTKLQGRLGAVCYEDYGKSGLTVRNCDFSDFCSKTILTFANSTRIENNRFFRCSKHTSDLTEMRGVVTNWGTDNNTAEDMTDIVVKGNVFERPGYYATLWLKCQSVVETDNVVRESSAIGLGHQWCSDLTIANNSFYRTFMNGIDTQECQRQTITGNVLQQCGWMLKDKSGADNLCQAIFVGSDYNRRASRDAVIANNTIEGCWTSDIFSGDAPEEFFMTGTGIVINNTDNFSVTNNTVRGMGRPYLSSQVSNEDGMGIRCMGNCSNFNISNNIIADCKSIGVLAGPANIVNGVIAANSIRSIGRDGIHVYATSKGWGFNISDNAITDVLNVYGLSISAGVFVGASRANLTQFRINENSIFGTDNEDSSSAAKTFTHGIYVGFDTLASDATYCGLGTHEIKNNFSNGYSVAPIEIDSRCYTSGSERHFDAIAGNRIGGISSGGLISAVPGNKGAMESVGSSVPTTGAHRMGDKVWRAFPSDNPIGWVCVEAGTPGKWKAINAAA
mgnify:CR=1 FL=1